MGTIRSGLLEKAEFGKFQKDNQDALATLQQAKQDIRLKRKLGEAQERAKQVKVKFKDQPSLVDESGIYREAQIKVGNRVSPIRATYSYGPASNKLNAPQEIKVHGIYDSNIARAGDPVNKVFRPSQLKQVLDAVKNRFPKAEQVFGERVTGIRAGRAASDLGSGEQIIPLMKKVGKKGMLLGLGLSLKEAIEAGKAAYDAKEGKL